MDELLLLALVLIVCHVAERAAGRLGFPAVTGYVVAGVAVGALIFHFIDPSLPGRLSVVGDVALGLIAFTVGSELYGAELKHLARSAAAIALCESLGAFLLVSLGVWAVTGDVALALLLGAVACATAPAATMMIIEQYKARGPLTSTILAVVGIDDAVALVIYGFAAAIARGVLQNEKSIHFGRAFGLPLAEIIVSVLVGAALGYLGAKVLKRTRGPRETATGAAAMILLGVGLAQFWGLSTLLTNMSMGCVLVNVDMHAKRRIARSLSDMSALVYGVFFVVAGSRLDISLLPGIGLVGGIYLLARVTGKVSGARLGAWLGRSPQVVRRYIGLSLIPQIGVAVALAILVDREFGHGQYGPLGDALASTVLNILLVTTIVTEIMGPVLTRWSLISAGEVGPRRVTEESYEPADD
jgi:Kef-type K+ transport system membrane component KefB